MAEGGDRESALRKGLRRCVEKVRGVSIVAQRVNRRFEMRER